MKGTATFTLANAATGRIVRQFAEHNLVTDAAKRLLSPPGCATLNRFSWSDHLAAAFPLYKNYFGGIILLGNTLTEKADNIMLSPDCIPVATAGGAYSGELTTRGSLNLNESYETADGYHFTWDFGTDKANGTIKCAALTCTAFGNSGFSASGSGGLILDPATMKQTSLNSQFCKAAGVYLGTFDRCRHIYVCKSGSEAVFSIINTPDPDRMGVNTVTELSANITPERTVRVELPFTIGSFAKPFVDSAGKKVYFFSGVYSQDDSLRLDCAAVSLESFTVTQTRSWDLPESSEMMTAALHDGKLYIASGSGITAVSGSGSAAGTWQIPGDIYSWFYTVNGVLMFTANNRIYYLLGGEWYSMGGSGKYGLGYSCDMQAPFFPASTMTYNYYETQQPSCNPYLAVAGFYFATINNLSEPLVKTNEHTLKITYDITN